MLEVNRLNELADVIENCEEASLISSKPEFGFNMKGMHSTCGSPRCIGGWTIELFSSLNEEDKRKLDLISNNKQSPNNLLGLTATQADQLFLPQNENAHWFPVSGDEYISPKKAANTLRHLAATGVVDWDAPQYPNNNTETKTQKPNKMPVFA